MCVQWERVECILLVCVGMGLSMISQEIRVTKHVSLIGSRTVSHFLSDKTTIFHRVDEDPQGHIQRVSVQQEKYTI